MQKNFFYCRRLIKKIKKIKKLQKNVKTLIKRKNLNNVIMYEFLKNQYLKINLNYQMINLKKNNKKLQKKIG